jgi:hypothetical protein
MFHHMLGRVSLVKADRANVGAFEADKPVVVAHLLVETIHVSVFSES